ncbi:unnamed protein product [Effrenium voratum]|nr:unnamed protein product [Effrenium voratum]
MGWSHHLYDVEVLEVNRSADDPGISLSILHVPDTHFSLRSDMSPWSDRMHRAFLSPKHFQSQRPTESRTELLRALHYAEAIKVDLLVLGGDLVNFPSQDSVDDLYPELARLQVPFVYTAGNHDWHLERLEEWEAAFDSQRARNEGAALQKLYSASGKGLEKDFADPLFGWVRLPSGLRVVCIDNSNFQIDEAQLRSFELFSKQSDPFVLVLHIPIFFPASPGWGINDLMAHPAWGAQSDQNSDLEQRKPWPQKAPKEVRAFVELVTRAARDRKLLAILTGHVHEDGAVAVPCGRENCPVQFTTRANFAGGARLLVLRLPSAGFVPAADTNHASGVNLAQAPVLVVSLLLLPLLLLLSWRLMERCRSRESEWPGSEGEARPCVLGNEDTETEENDEKALEL